MSKSNYCIALRSETDTSTIMINPSESPWTQDESLTAEPARVRECPKNYVSCCGMCTRKCSHRCILDLKSRLHMLYVNEKSRRELEGGPMTTIESVLSSPISYDAAVELISHYISGYHNSYRRKELRRNGISENPHKYNYAPRVAINPSTGKPEVDPITGHMRIMSWPYSGLCPHCLPTSGTRSRGKYNKATK